MQRNHGLDYHNSATEQQRQFTCTRGGTFLCQDNDSQLLAKLCQLGFHLGNSHSSCRITHGRRQTRVAVSVSCGEQQPVAMAAASRGRRDTDVAWARRSVVLVDVVCDRQEHLHTTLSLSLTIWTCSLKCFVEK